MSWTLEGGQPIWQQLCRRLERQIVAGEYPPGGRLPPVRELAAQAGVNPNTMQRALAQLESDGLTAANRTAGRTVTADPDVIENLRRRLARLAMASYLEDMTALGYSRQQAAELLKEECEHDG